MCRGALRSLASTTLPGRRGSEVPGLRKRLRGLAGADPRAQTSNNCPFECGFQLRRVSEAVSPPRGCVACLAMLVEDTTAFIEQLEVPKDRKRTDKHRRRVAQAELEVLEAVRDVRVAAEALQQMERTFARAVEPSSVSTRRRLLRVRGARSLEREIETVRAHLEAKRDQLPAKQERLFRIEQRARERDAARRSARMFRLHSARHHLDCSAPLVARLMASQLSCPFW